MMSGSFGGYICDLSDGKEIEAHIIKARAAMVEGLVPHNILKPKETPLPRLSRPSSLTTRCRPGRLGAKPRAALTKTCPRPWPRRRRRREWSSSARVVCGRVSTPGSSVLEEDNRISCVGRRSSMTHAVPNVEDGVNWATQTEQVDATQLCPVYLAFGLIVSQRTSVVRALHMVQ